MKSQESKFQKYQYGKNIPTRKKYIPVLYVQCIYFLKGKEFSSPELKAQVSYSDRLLSIVRLASVC
jgi:hypothetical protein